MKNRTERIEEEASSSDEQKKPRTWIVRIGSAADPLALAELMPLDDLNRLVLGRRDDVPDERAGRIEVRDRWMSGEHAVLEKTDTGWQISDLGSSNGTLVWGERRSTTTLHDGDIFETGSTFWIFRSMVVPESAKLAPPDEGILG